MNLVAFVKKQMKTASFTIVETLVLIPFLEVSLSKIPPLDERRFLYNFWQIATKTVFSASDASSKWIRLFFSSKQMQKRSFKLIQTMARIPFVEASISWLPKWMKAACLRFFADSAKFVSYAWDGSSNCIRSFSSSNESRWLLWQTLNLWFRYLSLKSRFWGFPYWKIAVIFVFCGFRKIRFQCQKREFKCNLVVIVLKRIQMTSFTIVETLV